MDAITQALAAIERLKLLGPGAVTGRLPPDPAYGPMQRPSMGGYMPDPGLLTPSPASAPAPAPTSGAGPTGLLSAPPSPGAAPPVGNLPPPQPISPMLGAPQAISPLVTGGKLPDLPAGGLQQQGDGKGFWDFLAEPSVSRGLMEMGMRLMAASAPSTDPRSGSLGFGLSQGLGGFMKGQDDVKAEQRQAENDAINRLYKQATIDSMANGGKEAPPVVSIYDSSGREQKAVWNAATGQYEPIGGSKAAGGGGAGGGAGTGANKPLPAGALKMTEDAYQNVVNADAALGKAQEIASMFEAGQLDFSLGSRAAYEAYKSTGYVAPGVTEAELVKMDSYYRFLSQLRNTVLMAAKGVQTEGDAQRALQQFEEATTTEARRAALNDIIEIMSRTKSAAQGSIDRVYANYGATPPGTAGVVPGGGGVLKYDPATGELE